MDLTSFESRRRAENLPRETLAQHQLRRLNGILDAILPQNAFYAEKLAHIERPLISLSQLEDWPYTTKKELLGPDQNAEFAVNRTFDIHGYRRFHRTSGTHGRPLAVVDRADDWQWWIDTWQYVLDAAQVTERDRALMAFSFGPFIGFWSAFEALAARGAMVVPGGGMTSRARLELLVSSQCNLMCCTPTYALHLAEVAEQHAIQPQSLGIRRIIVAGEPGGSLFEIRQRIADTWDAQVIDHGGATEIGPWGYGSANGRGLHIVETEFIAEFRSLETDQPANEGELSELILTTLGRAGCPVLRYRTGDLVRPTWCHPNPTNHFVLLEGGVLGRKDDMVVIRGVNVFPSAVEQILRGFPDVVEYRIVAHKIGAMDALSIEVEDKQDEPQRIMEELTLRLGFKIQVRCVPLGSLPRFEGKGKRFVDQRAATP